MRVRRERAGGSHVEAAFLNAEPRPGDLVDGRFAILDVIGRGGMASVFKATDRTTGLLVALKIPFPQLERDSVFRDRFRREADVGRTLDHAAFVRVLPVHNPSRLYLAMEYVAGRTLWDRLRHERPIPLAEAIDIARRLCDALDHMQRHEIFHRDLKPGNVMLCADGSVRIMDFGVAMTAVAPRLTLAGAKGIGTPEYMAPEQLSGRRGDHRADIYSLGAMLYEMTTGRRPYDEQPDMYSLTKARLVGDPVAPRAYNRSMSPALEEVILRALARDPRDRYGAAAELRGDLDRLDRVVVTGRAARLRPVSLPSQAWLTTRLVIAALLAPVVLFFVFLLLLTRHR